MTDLRQVSDYCKAFLDSIPLDTLILNAGIMAVPLGQPPQGHSMPVGVDIAHFLVQGFRRSPCAIERGRGASPAASSRVCPSRTCFPAR